ncbi:MAG: hypothetical protein LUF26_07205 [Firmicutes bacterium]|nr:hypothetical protein [Bacillota bacterium]
MTTFLLLSDQTSNADLYAASCTILKSILPSAPYCSENIACSALSYSSEYSHSLNGRLRSRVPVSDTSNTYLVPCSPASIIPFEPRLT